MIPRSSILFIFICSNHKAREGESADYATSYAIRNHIPEESAQKLYEVRKKIMKLIKETDIYRDNKRIAELPLNKHLVHGPDFQFRGLGNVGLYLPASQRYIGRFYQELLPNAREVLGNTKHHILIVSGLYGLVLPLESIQAYSCNVGDDSKIAERWTNRDTLTIILISYIHQHSVSKVIEFMAVKSYKRLISWEMVRHAVKANVMHAFSRQYAGDSLLSSLGALANEMLNSWADDRLLTLKPGDSIPVPKYDDQIVFHCVPTPEGTDIVIDAGLEENSLTITDRIGRMRRNIIKILSSLTKAKDYQDDFGIGRWLNTLMENGVLPHSIGKLIRNIARLRNHVEYHGHQITPEEWENMRKNYITIETWATKEHSLHITLEKV